jgi:hypothetical protein
VIPGPKAAAADTVCVMGATVIAQPSKKPFTRPPRNPTGKAPGHRLTIIIQQLVV